MALIEDLHCWILSAGVAVSYMLLLLLVLFSPCLTTWGNSTDKDEKNRVSYVYRNPGAVMWTLEYSLLLGSAIMLSTEQIKVWWVVLNSVFSLLRLSISEHIISEQGRWISAKTPTMRRFRGSFVGTQTRCSGTNLGGGISFNFITSSADELSPPYFQVSEARIIFQ